VRTRADDWFAVRAAARLLKPFMSNLTRFAALVAVPVLGLTRSITAAPSAADSVAHLKREAWSVVELRRYTTAPHTRPRFAAWFDAYFPEAFEQLGALVFGQFLDCADPNRFVWLRGYRDLGARPIVNAAFYYGPLWREHRTKVNAILPDSDNVLLLQPLPGHALALLPAVDPIDEPHGAQGIVVMHIFAVRKGHESAFAAKLDPVMARWRADGARDVGLLATLDVPDNFPQLPVREDGPWLVWIGLVRDRAALDALTPALDAGIGGLAGSGMLCGDTERLVLDPSPRSRLRWLDKETAP